MTAYYRLYYTGRFRPPEKQQRLNKYMHMLLRTAQTNKVAVVVTNQMQSNPDSSIFERSMPVGGHVMLHAITHVVHLRRLKLDNYHAELYISPYYPRKAIDFVIDQRGVADGGAT